MAEYERDPERIERQARLFANGQRLVRVARELIEFAANSPQDTPPQMRSLAQAAGLVLNAIYRPPPAQAPNAPPPEPTR
jgi:hypothetical protein